MQNTHIDLSQLAQFKGSGFFYSHLCNCRLLFTEGIEYLVKITQCHWLIDEVGLILPNLLTQHPDSFYCIRLRVIKQTAFIIIGDGNGQTYMRKKIEDTDFPLQGKTLKLYLCESDYRYCLMLPSEY